MSPRVHVADPTGTHSPQAIERIGWMAPQIVKHVVGLTRAGRASADIVVFVLEQHGEVTADFMTRERFADLAATVEGGGGDWLRTIASEAPTQEGEVRIVFVIDEGCSSSVLSLTPIPKPNSPGGLA